MTLATDLRNRILKREVSLTDALQTVRIIAIHLEQEDIKTWCERELNGYADCVIEDLPPYRIVSALPRAFNPYRGWIPVQVPEKDRELLHRYHVGFSIAEVEKGAEESGLITATYPEYIQRHLEDGSSFDVRAHLSSGALGVVREQVRTKLIDWLTNLAKAGFSGEEISMSTEQEKRVSQLTQNFYSSNVGNAGPVSNSSTTVGTMSIHNEEKETFVQSLRTSLAALPLQEREKISEELDRYEASDKSGDRFSQMLSAVRNVALTLPSNIAASGIVAAIGALAT